MTRRLVVQEFLTLDGVMQGPGGPDEDRSGGFDLGGWEQQGEPDEVGGRFVMGGIEEATGLLIGRVTYDIWADYWPNHLDNPVGRIIDGYDRHVASRTLVEPLSWSGTNLISDDLPRRVAALKERGSGSIIVMGSGGLVQSLIEHDLIDEYRLLIHPIILGKGKKLFRDEAARASLRLVEAVTSPTGVVLATYVPAR